MVKAACHCTAVRFEIDPAPTNVFDCNCTICRRYGALWAYSRGVSIRLLSAPEETSTYVWGDKMLAFHTCKTCGCTTHFQALEGDHPIVAVNARMIATLDPANVRLRQLENAHTGWFWTKSDDPPIPSRHPKMPMPGPDDWR